MIKQQPWYIPSKRRGQRLAKMNLYWDANLMQAASEIAAEEGAKFGIRISAPALLTNLAIHRGEYFTDVRRRLRTRYKQLNREHSNATNNHQPTITPSPPF